MNRRREKGKRWELALELLEECKTWATPDIISYSAAISAFAQGGRWQHALALLEIICKEGGSSNMACYNVAFGVCEKGEWQHAQHGIAGLFETLCEEQAFPHAMSFAVQ